MKKSIYTKIIIFLIFILFLQLNNYYFFLHNATYNIKHAINYGIVLSHQTLDLDDNNKIILTSTSKNKFVISTVQKKFHLVWNINSNAVHTVDSDIVKYFLMKYNGCYVIYGYCNIHTIQDIKIQFNEGTNKLIPISQGLFSLSGIPLNTNGIKSIEGLDINGDIVWN